MMIASCRYARSSALAEHQRGRFADFDSEYPVSVGVDYIVVGMGIFENVLHLLVRDDGGRPAFLPAGLFCCGSQDLPGKWSFVLLPGISARGTDLWSSPCAALWGYAELVSNPEHAALLGEGDEAALLVFFKELMRLESEERPPD